MEKLHLMSVIPALYIVVTSLVGAMSVRYTKDTQSFMTAKSLMGPTIVGILLMSEFVATGSSLGTAESAYGKGISASWNVISLGLAFVLYGIFMAPRFQASGAYTISGAIGQKFGRGTQTVVSLIMIYALVVVNVAAFTGGGVLLSTMLGTSIQVGICIFGVASILNVTLGGIRGVGYSNLIHMFFKFVSLISISAFAWYMLEHDPQAAARIPAQHYSPTGVGVPTLFSWTFANIGAIFATQYVIQSIASLTTPAQARKASFIASVALVPAGLMAAFIGIAARGVFPDIKPVLALPSFLTAMPSWMAGLAVMGIVAVTFVTILACQIGTTALVMSDFVIPLLKPDEQRKLVLTRGVSILVGLAPIPFALFVPGLLDTIFFARALRTTIAVVAVFMFYLPSFTSGPAAVVGLLGSVVATSTWFALGNPFGIDNVYVAIATPALCLLAGRLLKGPAPMRNGSRLTRPILVDTGALPAAKPK
ncbi:Sodium/glucose cotransporter [Methylobacterium brachiatum]|nr:Sodium/glucose cotransporter [Methylobacterium brachiatum]